MQQEKLSLPAVILININIMLGAGIFINTLPLAKQAGLLGAAVYAVIGITMLPLVLTISELLKIHHGGSFYIFAAKEINIPTGFFVSWAYFTGKLASSTLMIHFFSLIVQSLIPALKIVNVFTLDLIIICIFSILNMLNLKAGLKIQSIFLVLKSIPILFVILSGLFLFNTNYITSDNMLWQGFLPTIPLVIFAFTGFEAACSISRHIKDPDKNAPKAILTSYAIVIFILCSFQFLFYSLLGPSFSSVGNYFEAFPYLLNNIFNLSEVFKFKIIAILQLAIASSALGGAYGILFSNNWNLYALVEHKHVFFHNVLGKLNYYKIPFICVLVEAFICISYLFITKGNNVQLQQIAALGSTIAYTISALALLFANFKDHSRKTLLPILAIFNCLILFSFCIKGLLANGIVPLIIFGLVLIIGMIMFIATKKNSQLN